jgi:hypothetical protein
MPADCGRGKAAIERLLAQSRRLEYYANELMIPSGARRVRAMARFCGMLCAAIFAGFLAGNLANAADAQSCPLGMKLETAEQRDWGVRVASTGAQFLLENGGSIRCVQRIPSRREIAHVGLPQRHAPWKLKSQDGFSCTVVGEGLNLTIQGDSLIILKADADLDLTVQGRFHPAYRADKEGKWLFIDEQGGFGIYPVAKHETPRPDFRQDPWSVAYHVKRGEEIWISIFPPRPYNWQRAYGDLMAHEGNETPYRFPSDRLIQSTARFCKVLVVHSWFWPGGDREPWKIPHFAFKDAKDRAAFEHMRDESHRRGVKVLPYFSPYYYSGKDFFAEVKRALDEYRVDGLYFDGVSMDFRKSYEMISKTRHMLGDRLLFCHCTSDPLNSNRIYCPFIDTYCDYIYRGEAGRGGLDLDNFLRWTVSGYHISNAVGYWVYTGSTGKPGYVRQVPSPADIDAAIRNEVRIPRTEIGYELNLAWPANDGHLRDFDRDYYGKLAARYETLKKAGSTR